MGLSSDEIKMEQTLNRELKPFGLSLSDTIDNVLSYSENPVNGFQPIKHNRPSLEDEKLNRIKKLPPSQWEMALSVLLNELKNEVTWGLTGDTYTNLTKWAFSLTHQKRGCKLSQLRNYLYEPFASSLPKVTPSVHIESCLAAIARGVKLASFIPNLQDEIAGGKTNVRIKKSPKTLKEIFVNDKAYKEAIKALQEVNTPVIDKSMNYLLGPRQKSAFTAWLDVLKHRGMLSSVDVEMIANILSSAIKGLSISGKTLRTPKNSRHRNTAYSKYYNSLLQKIPKEKQP